MKVTARQAAWTVKRFLEEKSRQATNIKRADNYVEQAFDDGTDAKELQQLVTHYRNDVIADPLASAQFLRPKETERWQQAVESSLLKYSVNFIRDKMLPTIQFHLNKGDVAAAKRVWDMREKKADDPARLLRDAIKDMRSEKWMEPVFRFGAFTLVNNAGISERHGKGLFEALKTVERLLKGKKLEFLLGGTVYLNHIEGKRFDASYTLSNDRLEINYARGQPVGLMTRSIVHELGHRLWFRFMDTGARDRFAQQWIEKGDDPDEPAERLPSVTPYGTKDRHEDFAETFTEVVMGKQKDRRLAERLQAVLPRGRVLSSVTASRDELERLAQQLVAETKKVDAKEQYVEQVIDQWRKTGKLNGRQLKLAITAYRKACATFLDFKTPSSLRPNEAKQVNDFREAMRKMELPTDEQTKRVHKRFAQGPDETYKAFHYLIGRFGYSIRQLVENIQVHDVMPEKSKVGSFNVVDDYGTPQRRFAPWVDMIRRAETILKRAGLGYLLYGDIHLKESPQSGARGGSFWAMYHGTGDFIDLAIGLEHRATKPTQMLATLIHELGHRCWFRFMDAGQRDVFSTPWIDQKEVVRETWENVKDVLTVPVDELKKSWELLEKNKFDEKQFERWLNDSPERKLRWLLRLTRVYDMTYDGGKPYAKRLNDGMLILNGEAFENMRDWLKRHDDEAVTMEKYDPQWWFHEGGKEDAERRVERRMTAHRDKAWFEEGAVDITIKDVQRVYEQGTGWEKAQYTDEILDVMKLKPVEPSVSPYGNRNRKEDFAETFTAVLLGENKDEAVKQRLQRALPKGRVLSSTNAAAAWYHGSKVPLHSFDTFVERYGKLLGRKHDAGWVLKVALKNSDTWQMIEPELTAQNRKRVQKATYQAAWPLLSEMTTAAARRSDTQHGAVPLAQQLTSKMTALLRNFSEAESKKVGDWFEQTFSRVKQARTPSGGKKAKEAAAQLLWALQKWASRSINQAAAQKHVEFVWNDKVQPLLPQLVKLFGNEGGRDVPTEMKVGDRLYENRAGLAGPKLRGFVTKLEGLWKGLKGWRRDALKGQLRIALAGPKDFRGTAAGLYKSEQDTMFVRATPTVMKRAAGTYGSPDYILVHELGHRYQHKAKRLPEDFDSQYWWTTPYSHKDGEKFAELFALGHFGMRNWRTNDFGPVVDRFESVMSGTKVEEKPEIPPHLRNLGPKWQSLSVTAAARPERNNGRSLAVSVDRLPVSKRMAARASFDRILSPATTKKLRAEFLALMRPVTRLSGYGEALEWHDSVQRWRRQVATYMDAAAKALDRVPHDEAPTLVVKRWQRELHAALFPLVTALGNTGFTSYQNAPYETNRPHDRGAVEQRLFAGFVRKAPKFVARTKKIANESWKRLDAILETLRREDIDIEVKSSTQRGLTAATSELYHTTSLNGLAHILKTRTFRSGAHGGFISVSEKPLFGDISGNDAVLVLDAAAVRSRLMPVGYTEQWYERYPEHAAYIAGQGWREQHQDPDDCYDDDGWADDGCIEQAYRDAEFNSFLDKKDEREWIARSSGDVRLPANAFKHLLVPKQKLPVAKALVAKLQLKIPIKTRA